DLTMKDKVASLDKEHNLYYVNPIEIQKYQYKGEMIKIKHKSIDLLVTPNHNLYLKEHHKDKWEFFKADNIGYRWVNTLNSINWKGKEKKYFEIAKTQDKTCPSKSYDNFLMDNWLEFLGWYIAEGWSQKRSNTHKNYNICISQTREKYVKEIENCLLSLNFNHNYKENRFLINSKQLWLYLKPLGKSYEKYIPKEFLNLSKRQLKILFDSLIKGDGRIDERNRTFYYTSSKKLADQIQEIGLKIGFNSTITSRIRDTHGKINGRKIKSKRPLYRIYFRKRKLGQIDTYKHIKKEFYNDIVYCCTVPSHILIVRRNGKPLICGNSGSYVYSANLLGIKFLGFELEEKYSIDIQKRFSQKIITINQKEMF
ncbi:MAG: LAGLIDADG family homing endonuclease, partial [Candidatus Thorarchaeota archaeon]